jgi:ATP-dependent DNA ligase
MRKAHLSRLLGSRPDGIFISPFEQGEIGPNLFRAACNMGLEGLVSKRRDRPYRGGQSKDWVKVKDRKHPAMERVRNIATSRTASQAMQLVQEEIALASGRFRILVASDDDRR